MARHAGFDGDFRNTVAFVLAGGLGERLRPLTAEIPKPLLSFGAAHRLLDFTLSNIRYSGLRRAWVLSQYMHDAIGRHLRTQWSGPEREGESVFLNQPPVSGKRYRGTADAVAQNLRAVPSQTDFDPILVLSADHVYRMDYRNLLSYHMRSGAGVTVAAVPASLDEARGFGVISADRSGRILDFVEKPERPAPVAGSDLALANMGVYVFDRWILTRAIEALGQSVAALDFGRHILPWMVDRDVAGVYRVRDGNTGAYWRDVGTLETYHASHMELLDDRCGFDIDDPDWPLVPGDTVLACRSRRTRVAASARVGDAWIERSVVGSGVVVGDGADVRDSVLLPGARVGAGAALRGVVVAETGRVAARDVIGFDRDEDRERFLVAGGDVVVVPASPRVAVAAGGADPSDRRVLTH